MERKNLINATIAGKIISFIIYAFMIVDECRGVLGDSSARLPPIDGRQSDGFGSDPAYTPNVMCRGFVEPITQSIHHTHVFPGFQL